MGVVVPAFLREVYQPRAGGRVWRGRSLPVRQGEDDLDGLLVLERILAGHHLVAHDAKAGECGCIIIDPATGGVPVRTRRRERSATSAPEDERLSLAAALGAVSETAMSPTPLQWQSDGSPDRRYPDGSRTAETRFLGGTVEILELLLFLEYQKPPHIHAQT